MSIRLVRKDFARNQLQSLLYGEVLAISFAYAIALFNQLQVFISGFTAFLAF